MTTPQHPPAASAAATPPQTRRVRSAERVAEVLELLRRSSRPLRHGEIAHQLAIPKSSATNLLETLAHVGLITADEAGYSLGVKLIELGASAAERLDMRAIARPALQELSQLGIGTANLAILQDHDVLYIEKVNNPDHTIQITTRIGGTVPAHMTALGKVLIAALEPEQRAAWIREHNFSAATPKTITSKREFARQLNLARDQGYALDQEEQNPHTSCVAAPVTNHSASTVAAISLTCLSSDMQDEPELKINAVTAAARAVSTLLGNHLR